MAYIRINFDGVLKMNDTIKSAIIELERIEDNMRFIQKALPPEIGPRYQIAQRLTTCQESTLEVRTKAKSLMDAVYSGMEEYQNAEMRLHGSISTDQI